MAHNEEIERQQRKELETAYLWARFQVCISRDARNARILAIEVERLRSKVTHLQAEVEQLGKARDAAVNDLTSVLNDKDCGTMCRMCRNEADCAVEDSMGFWCRFGCTLGNQLGSRWEWRGLCAENTEGGPADES